MSDEVTLVVNGEEERVQVEPGEPLLFTLRERLGRVGVKQSCDFGGCGACTVILDDHKTVYSCMTLTEKVSGSRVTTVEGLEKSEGELDPLQRSFMENWALQCGFCTPGILLSARCLLDQNPSPSVPEIKEALGGHICRCTGYLRIIEAVATASRDRGSKR